MLLKDALKSISPTSKSESSDRQINFSDQLSPQARQNDLASKTQKLQKLVNETFWRFQIVKPSLVELNYGCISNLSAISNDAPSLVNDRHQTIIYEIMKKRKRRRSSGSSHPFVDSLNIPATKSNSQTKLTTEQPSQVTLGLPLSKIRTLTGTNFKILNTIIKIYVHFIRFLKGGTVTSIGTKDKRRSLESHRSLSLIYPINKYKRSNQTIMKLLSDIPTLSVLCLKEHKFSEANQLYQMHSSDVQNSFELRQIKYHAAYEHCLNELKRLSEKKAASLSKMSQNHEESLIEASLHSLDIVKVLEPILDIEKDENLIQAIVLSDVVVSSSFNLNLSLALVDHSKSKLNSNVNQPSVMISDNYVEIDELKGFL